MKKVISVKSKSVCVGCHRNKSTINDLCNSCTIKRYGKIMPWLNEEKVNNEETVTTSNIFK
jgi:hypothetical protein